MLSCDDAAKYFLAQVSEDAGDLISCSTSKLH